MRTLFTHLLRNLTRDGVNVRTTLKAAVAPSTARPARPSVHSPSRDAAGGPTPSPSERQAVA